MIGIDKYKGPAAVATAIIMGLGATGCSTSEAPKASTSGPAVPGNTDPNKPSPNEGNPAETPTVVVNFETPKEKIDPLTAKEALNIPDELDGDGLAKASHEGPGAIYEKFREFMKFQDPAGMSDEEFAQKVYEKINRASNAYFMMHLSDKWGDENGNNSRRDVRQQCTDARNGLYGYPESGTLTKESQIACEQRENRDRADIAWDKPNPIHGSRGPNPKPYKEGWIYDGKDIEVIARSGDTISFTVKKRALLIVNNLVLREAGLVEYDGSEDMPDTDTSFTETYQVTVKDGEIKFILVKDNK